MADSGLTARRTQLVIGTAAIGMPYGLPLRDGSKPTVAGVSEATAILQKAQREGVGAFDTAPAYGLAEVRVGEALGGAGTVWTKTSVCATENCLERSLERLCRASIDLLQWHNWTRHLDDDPDFDSWWRAASSDSRVAALGATTYGVDDALAAVVSGRFALVQVEWNLLNRAVVPAVEGAARRCGVKIAVRSVLLQGVLTDRGRSLPPRLAPLQAARDRAAELADANGISLAELAIRAALDEPGIDHVLVGIDSLRQLEQTLAAADRPPLDSGLQAAAINLNAAHSLTDPRSWRLS